MTTIPPVADDEAMRIAGTLTKDQRRFLQRRYCGWCEARIDRDTCQAMYGKKGGWR